MKGPLYLVKNGYEDAWYLMATQTKGIKIDETKPDLVAFFREVVAMLGERPHISKEHIS